MSSSGERKLLPLFTPRLNLEAESFVTERSNEIVIRDPEEALNVHVIINFKPARLTSPSKISPSKNLTLHFPIKIDFGEILLGEVNRAPQKYGQLLKT